MTKKKKLLIASISIITAVSILFVAAFSYVLLFTDPFYISVCVLGAGYFFVQMVGLPVVDLFTEYDVNEMRGMTIGEIEEEYGAFDRVLMSGITPDDVEAYAYDLPFGFGLSFERGYAPQITGYGSSDWISYDEYLARYTYSSN